ncbi:MAG: insulinase family protein, partial [Candidatus Izemoplasmatales bacterium]
DKSMVGILFSNEYEWTPETNLYLTMYEQALSIKLIEVIREKMSGVYSPQTQMSLSKHPTSSYTLMVLFGCSPKNTNKLTKAVLKIMNQINKKGIDEETLDKVKEQMLRKRETDVKTNRFWLSKISESEFNGEPLSVNEFEAKVKAVTSKQIQETAQKLINKDHSVRVVLYPEKK